MSHVYGLRSRHNAHVLVGIAATHLVPEALGGVAKSVRADLAKPVTLWRDARR